MWREGGGERQLKKRAPLQKRTGRGTQPGRSRVRIPCILEKSSMKRDQKTQRPGTPPLLHRLPAMTPDSDDYVFVIKLYDEGRRLRGHFTDAYGHRRHPIHRPEDVLAHLEPYLTSMRVRLRLKSRLLLWLSRLGAPPARNDTAPSKLDR